MNDSGFVPLATIAKFNRVRHLTNDLSFISEVFFCLSFFFPLDRSKLNCHEVFGLFLCALQGPHTYLGQTRL